MDKYQLVEENKLHITQSPTTATGKTPEKLTKISVSTERKTRGN